jgi:hypothetical protein
VTDPKTETVAEFVARGGKIQVFPEAERSVTAPVVRPTTPAATANLMSLDEGAHFFAEIKPKKKRKVKDLFKDIKVEFLPEDIRKLLGI